MLCFRDAVGAAKRGLTFAHSYPRSEDVKPLVAPACGCEDAGTKIFALKGEIMNKLKMVVVVASMFALSSALAQSTRVPGEKLDSGLGKLSASYTGKEFMPKGHVLGESLDSGLGQLSADYTGIEFMPAGTVIGESLDSGLGNLGRDYTAWEFMPAGSLLGESLDSGAGYVTQAEMERYMTGGAIVHTALGR